MILSEVDKQNLKFDETGKSESKKVRMQDLISLAKGTVPLLENETGSVTEDSGSVDPSLKNEAVQKLEKELLELKLKYEADVSAIKEKCEVVSGTGVEAGPKDVTSFSQLKTIFKREFNPIAYGILRLSQLRGGGGGGFLSYTPENNVKII